MKGVGGFAFFVAAVAVLGMEQSANAKWLDSQRADCAACSQRHSAKDAQHDSDFAPNHSAFAVGFMCRAA
jgi:hypothetical protein